MRVDNRVRFDVEVLERAGVDALELRKHFTYPNPAYAAAKRRAGNRYEPRNIPKVIKTWRVEDGELSFPRGALLDEQFQKLITRLVGGRKAWDFHVPEAFEDGRTTGDARLLEAFKRHKISTELDRSFELRSFQKRLIRAAIEAEDGVWNSEGGSGKTESALFFAWELGLPTLVVAPALKIFDHWVKRCKTRFGMDVGVIQGKRRTVGPITIAMQQTLRNCVEEYADLFGVVIIDEAQMAAAETFEYVIDSLKAKYRLGITMDERRSDGMEDVVYDVFGPVCCKVTRDELIEGGFIHDAEIRIVTTEFHRQWYDKLRPNKKQFAATRLQTEMTEDGDRNRLVHDVVGWCKDYQTLVLSHRVEHCRVLDREATAAGLKSGLFLGGKNNETEFKECYQRMHDGRLNVAFGTYKAVGVGFDLPLLARGVFTTPVANSSKGEMQFNQFCARLERVSFDSGKSGAVVYYLWDEKTYGERPLRNIKKWRRNVKVLRDGQWVPVDVYLKARMANERESTPGFGNYRPPSLGKRRIKRLPRAR